MSGIANRGGDRTVEPRGAKRVEQREIALEQRERRDDALRRSQRYDLQELRILTVAEENGQALFLQRADRLGIEVHADSPHAVATQLPQ